MDQSSPNRSENIDVLRTIAMIFVMFLHTPVPQESKTFPLIYLSEFLGWGAVPCFFLISGYLADRKIHDLSVPWLVWTKSKLVTLGIPFLFWNSLFLAGVWVLKLAGIATISRGHGAYFDLEPTLASNISALLGIGRHPIVYQFWFLRDLIVVSIFAPVLLRHFPKIPFLGGFLLLLPSQLANSMGYFLLGCSLHGIALPVRPLSNVSINLYMGAWVSIGLAVLGGLLTIHPPLVPLGSAVFLYFLSRSLLGTSTGIFLAALGPATFFIYAVHEPTQSILGKLWDASHIPFYGSSLGFLTIPALVFALCSICYFAIHRLYPQCLWLLTGSR